MKQTISYNQIKENRFNRLSNLEWTNEDEILLQKSVEMIKDIRKKDRDNKEDKSINEWI